MDFFFVPRSVAVIGASREPHKVGHRVLRNILEGGYAGEVYPVNPNADEVLGRKCYPSVRDVPGDVDLAVICVPARLVPGVLEECGEKGVKGVIIVSSGFKEVGNVELEEKVKHIARKHGIRIIGPNVFGLVSSRACLNATFGPSDVLPGNVAIVTQSGALGVALMGWTKKTGVGLSAVVSLGNRADVDEADVLNYLENDEHTRVIVFYVEGLENGRKFMDAVRRCSKPVIVVKAGRSAGGARAASLHTGSVAGEDYIYDGVLKQVGAIRARSVRDAFVMARTLASMPEPVNDEVLIITNGGGFGVMAADRCEERDVPLYSGPDLVEFDRVIPPFGSKANPVDLTGQAGPDMYAEAVRIGEKTSAGALVVLYCETTVHEPADVARAVADAYTFTKPMAVAVLGGPRADEAKRILEEKGIPVFSFPEEAVDAVAGVTWWHRLKKKRLQ